MTSLATFIVKLHSLVRQSQFHLSQFLGALIHLPRVWRGLHAELHLSSLTWKVLQLTRQLRSESLIRIGAPPLLKLTESQPKLEPEMQASPEPSVPVDLFRMQNSLAGLEERIYKSHNALPAITRKLFQTPRRSSISSRLRDPHQTPQVTRPIISGGESLEEEKLREMVVETWLQRSEEAGVRPILSFAEGHILYRELFEEFVNTGILPPNLFSQRFLETRGDLTFEQARTDLRARLNEPTPPNAGLPQIETRGEEMRPIASPFLPSYIPTILWAKGSLTFGAVAPTRALLIPADSTRRMSSTIPPASPAFPERKLWHAPHEVNETRTARLDSGVESLREGAFVGIAERVPHRSLMKTEVERDSRHEIDSVKGVEESNVSEEPRGLNEVRREDMSRETYLPAMDLKHAEALRFYSPTEALIASLALHSKVAFIWPLAGSRLGTSSTSPSTIPRPTILMKDHTREDVSSEPSALPPPREKTEQGLERPLTIFESRPVIIYLRPPMSLPALENPTGQSVLPITLPSSNMASTRENISLQSLKPQMDGEVTEGHRAEEECLDTDAELQESVKRIGRIIAEEARRHIGSS